MRGSVAFFVFDQGTKSEKAAGTEGTNSGAQNIFFQGPGFTDEEGKKDHNPENQKTCVCHQDSLERLSQYLQQWAEGQVSGVGLSY